MLKFSEAINEFHRWRMLKVRKDTVSGYDHHLRIFCLYLKNPNIEDITLDHVVEYLSMMKTIGWDENGFQGRCIALKKFFEFYRRQGFKVLDENLIPIPHREYREQRVASEVEYRKVLAVIPEKSNDHRYPRNKAILNLLYDTGARINEICSLRLSQINFDERKALIRTEKTNAGSAKPQRFLFWSEETNQNILKYLPSREKILTRHPELDHDYLFIGITGLHSGKPLQKPAIAEFLRQYSRRANVHPVLNAHSFRHLMAHDILKNSNNIIHAKEVLGHATIVSTQHYLKLNETEIKKGWDSAKRG